MPDYAVEVNGVSMHFNHSSEKIENLKEYFIKFFKGGLLYKDFIAINNISLGIEKGEVFGIVGSNGSGKSTLLKIIAGILTPTTGNIKVNGNTAPLIELGAGFDGDLTAGENIYLNGAVLGYSKSFLDEKYNSIVEFAELEEFMSLPLKNYSSGMIARIAFSIATATEPDILLVDEILSVGDYKFQNKCEKRIKNLIDNGTSVILVSHDTGLIENMCTRCLWLEKGNAVMIDEAKKVCMEYKKS